MRNATHSDGRPPEARTHLARPADTIVFAAILATLMLWVPLLTQLRFPPKGDEKLYHVPNVLRFSDHFPSLREMRGTDLSMLPMLHGALGAVSRWVGQDLAELRVMMVVIGLIALLLYLVLARELGLDMRWAGLGLVAFPYFGMTYFTVMTDFPALLVLLLSLLAQIEYLRKGRPLALWGGMIAAAAACLMRQNMAYILPVFAACALLSDHLAAKDDALAASSGPPQRRRFGAPLVAAALLPLACLAFQIWLWKGLVPPAYKARSAYYVVEPGIYLLSALSIAANLGYYVLPGVAVLAWSSRKRESRRAWLVLLGTSLAAAAASLLIRGPGLVNIYGTFSHALLWLRTRSGGVLPSLAVMWACLFCFAWIVRQGFLALRRDPEPGSILVFALLLTGVVAVGFGLFRIYERHLLPVDALILLVLLRASQGFPRRTVRVAWAALVLFGVAHGVLYATAVYGIGR